MEIFNIMANTATMNNNTTVLNNGMNENERNNKMETITNNTTLNNETITEPDENEVLIDTLFDDIENENKESKTKTWTEECFLDRMGASQELKEWADRTSDSFFEEHDIGNIHPDYTAVRVPVRFHRELRKLGMTRDYSSGTYLWEGVWYFPADREFLELIQSE